jgi:hypothetical protein
MSKEPIKLPTPEPAEPSDPPINDPEPYKDDPVMPPPGAPDEDRPLRDPRLPGTNIPQL